MQSKDTHNCFMTRYSVLSRPGEQNASQIAKKRLPLQQGLFQGSQVRATQGFKCIPWVLVAGLAVDPVDLTYTRESLMRAVAGRLEDAGLLYYFHFLTIMTK